MALDASMGTGRDNAPPRQDITMIEKYDETQPQQLREEIERLNQQLALYRRFNERLRQQLSGAYSLLGQHDLIPPEIGDD